jgi:hypothetical protein
MKTHLLALRETALRWERASPVRIRPFLLGFGLVTLVQACAAVSLVGAAGSVVASGVSAGASVASAGVGVAATGVGVAASATGATVSAVGSAAGAAGRKVLSEE